MFAMVVATFTWRLKGDLRRSCRCRAANESNRSNRERFARHCGRSYHFPIAVSKAKEAESNHVKYWEIIIENLRNAGWNCGCMRTTDGKGRPIWVVAAERSDAGRFIVEADRELPAFLELESAIQTHRHNHERMPGIG
jgi:hypothetical protein